MLITPSKCPICEEMSVYTGACEKCWWIDPNMLRYQANSYDSFKEFIVAGRQGRIMEEKKGGFTIYKIRKKPKRPANGCVFCGIVPKGHNGPHHIVPDVIRKAMGFTAKKAVKVGTHYKVPMCKACHTTLSALQQPLILIINHLVGRGPVPDNLGKVVEGVYKGIYQSSLGKASKLG